MNLQDKINLQGYFKITAYKSDGSIEVIEDKNLIMDKARNNMAELASGCMMGSPITKFIIGTAGHNPDTNNILEPISVGTYGFTPTRTETFSKTQNKFRYNLTWDPFNPVSDDFVTPVTWNNREVTLYARGNKLDETGVESGAENTPCEVNIKVLGNSVLYTITLPEAAANGVTGDSTIAFTEAALFSGSDIFSLKTFSARVKDPSVKYVIEWRIIF